MKLYGAIGNYLYNFIVITVLSLLSALLIIPFYGFYVGVFGFFESDNNYKYLFITIKENIKNIILVTFLIIVLGGLIYLNQVLRVNGFDNIFNDIMKYVFILLIIILLIYPPIIMISMKVTTKQLFLNTVYMTFVHFKKTIIMILITGLFIWLVLFELIAVLLILPWLQSIHYFASEAIKIEKTKRKGDYNNEETI